MSDEVFVKFEYDERDVWNAMRLRLGQRVRVAFALVAATAALFGVSFAVASDGARYVAGGVFAVVTAVVVFAVCRAAPPTMFRGELATPSDGSREPDELRDASMSVDVSPEGVAVTVGKRMAKLGWAAVDRLDGDARTYVLFHGKGGFVVVPRRAFRNAKRDTAFRDLVEHFLAPPDDDAEDEDEDDDG